MKKDGFLMRHRSLFLIAVLTATLFVSSAANRRQLEQNATPVSLPVTAAVSAVSAYQADRSEAYVTDVDALYKLTMNADLDAATREAAAARLTELTSDRQAEEALELALSQSSLAPCTAVVAGGSVTIVTEKATVTQEDTALVLTLADAHAHADGSKVRIITAAGAAP